MNKDILQYCYRGFGILAIVTMLYNTLIIDTPIYYKYYNIITIAICLSVGITFATLVLYYSFPTPTDKGKNDLKTKGFNTSVGKYIPSISRKLKGDKDER